VVFP